jgi:serine/threonine-protein kinase HipA
MIKMNNRCLYCYQLLSETEQDFHAKCSKKFFGIATPPIIDFDEEKLNEMALKLIKSQISITGVQPKLSLDLINGESKSEAKRFTIVGLLGNYILKPPTPQYLHLPEVEDLTMHLAEIVNIKTVPHALIRLSNGHLAYITKRIDRTKSGEKLPMEDMCQLTEKLTEDKYQGSYEQIAKIIQKYSSNPGFDLVNFYEQIVFSFITGNADMHLKNFSLINLPNMGNVLAPAYDMVATKLVNPADHEELALTLNGKKNRIKKADFETVFSNAKLSKKQQENIFDKMHKAHEKWLIIIETSFLTENYKEQLKKIINERMLRLKS